MIPDALQPKDTRSSFDLPELNDDEIRAVIAAEKNRRALLTKLSPDEITLTRETFERILLKARQQKLVRNLEKAYWDKVDQIQEPIRLSPEQMKYVFLKRASKIIGKQFVIDEFNQEIIDKLSHYFSGSYEAEKYGMSLSKGILLMGERGTGKTVIMRAFSENPHQSFKVTSVRFITYDFVETGFQVVKNFCVPESIAINVYGQSLSGFCFDDLGTDEERRRYGDKVNAMGEILLNRYDCIDHHFTHVTTNLNANAIEEFYGPRLRSRFREMFNVISFDVKSPDRRK